MSSAQQRKIRQVLSDLFVFVRSQEVNRAIAAVTQEQLIEEQILRNGETALSNQAQFNPYSFDANATPPASTQLLARANYAGGSDVNLPTKMDRIMAMKNEVDSLISEVKKLPPSEISAPDLDDDTSEDILSSADQVVK